MKSQSRFLSQVAVVFSMTFCLMLARPASAFMPPNVSYLERTQTSDLILAGTIQKIGDGRAQFAVERAFKGDVAASVVEVSPIEIRTMASRVFREGETVVLFLKRAAPLTIIDGGWASLTYTPPTKAATFEAIERLLELPPISDREAVAQTMFELVTSDNPLLKSEARSIISNLPYDRDDPLRYEEKLVELLGNPDADVRQTALYALQFRQSKSALPLILTIARGDNQRLVETASLALAQYDTPETVATLIALSQSPNIEIKLRAMVDLDDSRRPEAKAALVARLDDANDRVRALAPGRFVDWLRRGQAAEIVPRIIEMLDDPSAEVQVAAARALGESADARAVAPLFAALKRPDLSEELERIAVGSLNQIYSHLDAATRPPVTDDLGLIAAIITRNRGFGPTSAVGLLAYTGSPQALEILRETARDHPDQYLRESAQRLLEQAAKAHK